MVELGCTECYLASTPGTNALSTIPAPSSAMIVNPSRTVVFSFDPNMGGKRRFDADGWLVGTPELIVEVASSSESYDLHEKCALRALRRARIRRYAARQSASCIGGCVAATHYEELQPGTDGVFRSVDKFPGLWLDAAALVQTDGAKIHEVFRQGWPLRNTPQFVAKLEAARKQR